MAKSKNAVADWMVRVSLKCVGKTSAAFKTDDGVKVIHKGKFYGMDEFKRFAAQNLGEKGQQAVEKLDEAFAVPVELDESLLRDEPQNEVQEGLEL